MKRFAKTAFNIILPLILALTLCVGGFAADAPVVVGLDIDESNAGLFLSGEIPDGMSAKISGLDCELNVYDSLEDAGVDVRTLFLVDVSTSMRQGSQKQVKELLSALIENKKDNEQYSIAAFGEEYRILADFTKDRYDISKAVEQLEWKDQSSSIYHAMETAAKAVRETGSDSSAFSQIVVFSDGVEKSEAGIIKEELLLGLKESPLPVHTIGFGYENNSEGLKELYAISRVSGGFSWELESASVVSGAQEKLTEYTNGVRRVLIALPDEAKDGAVRPLELFDSSGASLLRHNLHMPRAAQIPPEPVVKPTDGIIPPEVILAPPVEPIVKPLNKLVVIGLCIAGLVLVAGIVLAILFLTKKKKPAPAKAPDKPASGDTQVIPQKQNRTAHLIPGAAPVSGGKFLLVLNDLSNPHKRLEGIVEDKLEIGRNPTAPCIAIDYDIKISQRHCVVKKRDSGLWIEDLGSTNHTFVNNEMVKSPQIIRDGDVLTCGETKFSIRIERR